MNKRILNIILLYIIYLFFYGIVVKFTIFNPTLFNLKTYSKVNLTDLLTLKLQYASIYKDNAWQEYPCYYGDGEQWNLIEI